MHTYEYLVMDYLTKIMTSDLKKGHADVRELMQIIKQLLLCRFSPKDQKSDFFKALVQNILPFTQLKQNREQMKDEKMVIYALNRFALLGQKHSYQQIKKAMLDVDSQNQFKAFGMLGTLQNTLFTFQALILMQDYEDVDLIFYQLEQIKEQIKKELKDYTLGNKRIFNRQLATYLKGLELDSKTVIKDEKLTKLCQETYENFVDKKLLLSGLRDQSSKLQVTYENWINSSILKDQRREYGTVILDGLMVCDVYFPDIDVIIEFDGPTHFFQNESTSLMSGKEDENELKDLSSYVIPSYQLQDRIVGAHYSKVIRFDYQTHNQLFQLGQLNEANKNADCLPHIANKIKKELEGFKLD